MAEALHAAHEEFADTTSQNWDAQVENLQQIADGLRENLIPVSRVLDLTGSRALVARRVRSALNAASIERFNVLARAVALPMAITTKLLQSTDRLADRVVSVGRYARTTLGRWKLSRFGTFCPVELLRSRTWVAAKELEYAALHGTTLYYFASEENRVEFLANPNRFLVQPPPPPFPPASVVVCADNVAIEAQLARQLSEELNVKLLRAATVCTGNGTCEVWSQADAFTYLQTVLRTLRAEGDGFVLLGSEWSIEHHNELLAQNLAPILTVDATKTAFTNEPPQQTQQTFGFDHVAHRCQVHAADLQDEEEVDQPTVSEVASQERLQRLSGRQSKVQGQPAFGFAYGLRNNQAPPRSEAAEILGTWKS